MARNIRVVDNMAGNTPVLVTIHIQETIHRRLVGVQIMEVTIGIKKVAKEEVVRHPDARMAR